VAVSVIVFLFRRCYHICLGRGHLCHKMANMVTGKEYHKGDKYLDKKLAWVSEADITLVCNSIATVLMDLRSSCETNGWCYGAARDILSISRWTDVGCRIILEPARSAWLRNQVRKKKLICQ
jgi:hypothetical protein